MFKISTKRQAINDLLGISIKVKKGFIKVDSIKYNKDINYQKPIK